MKLVKKLLFTLLLCLVSLSLVSKENKVVIAAEYNTVYDQSGRSGYAPYQVNQETIYGMYHEAARAKTLTNGASREQFINVLSMKTDGVKNKLVTWQVQDDNSHYRRATITEAARDYEKKNPGWIVIGGTNADQYFFKFGQEVYVDGSWLYQPSPYYPMVCNGEKVYPVSITGNYANMIGIKNDGSSDGFARKTGLGGFVVEIIDENNEIIEKFPVEAINKTATANNTTVWAAKFSVGLNAVVDPKDVTTNGSLFVIENAEIAYLANSREYAEEGVSHAFDAFFGRGAISSSDAKTYTLGKGQFAIETNNEALIAKLANGVRVRVEQEYADPELNACDEAIGYHTCHKLNNVDIPVAPSNSYDSKAYSRSLIGKKADGTYVLITADLKGEYKCIGLNADECNAVAAYYGVEEMYQMDGGGSVTAMVRTSDGTFKVTNFPSDSGNPNNPRSNLSYLFFVMRDSGVTVSKNDTTHYSITLNKINPVGVKIEDLVVKVNDKKYDFTDDQLVISGLNDNTEYTVSFDYNIVKDSLIIPSNYEIKVKTKEYLFPNQPIVVSRALSTGFEFSKPESIYSKHISNVVVHIGSKSYTMGKEDIFTVNGLIKDSEYQIWYDYDIYDEASGNTYHETTDKEYHSTTAFEIPYIEKFAEVKKTDSSITFEYQYTDPDRKVTKAYILYGTNTIDLIGKSGEQKVSKLDFNKNTYIFSLILEYKDLEDNVIRLKSTDIVYLKPAYIAPSLESFTAVRDSSVINVDYSIIDAASRITSMYILLNDTIVTLEELSGSKALTNLLFANTSYSVSLVYTYINEDGTEETHKSNEVVFPKDLIAPTINNITIEKVEGNTSINVTVSYTDVDKVITKVIVRVTNGSVEKEVELSNNSVTIDGLDITSANVVATLILEYIDANQTKTITQQSNVIEKVEKPQPKKGCGKKGVLIVLSLIALSNALIFIKKKH